jgi:hypothetical protein
MTKKDDFLGAVAAVFLGSVELDWSYPDGESTMALASKHLNGCSHSSGDT